MRHSSSSTRRPGPAAASAALLISLALVSPPPVAAGSGPILSDGWIRVLTPRVPAAGYFVLTNPTDQPLLLTGASSSACGSLMLHESIETSGTARMTMVKSVTVPAHGRVQFQPGSYHLMCMSPRSQLAPGETVPVSLHFLDGTSVTSDFRVLTAKGK